MTSGPTPDTAELLADIARTYQRYLVISKEQAAVLALWTAHTYAIGAAHQTPYLHIRSRERRRIGDDAIPF